MRGWVGASIWCGALLGCGRAAADEPATANVVQVGLGFRYGIDPVAPACEDNCSAINPWGPGIGVNAGYTLLDHLYLGANFDYFFGAKRSGSGFEESLRIWQLMAEAGYDFGVAPKLVVRPKFGAGLASLTSKSCGAPSVAGSTPSVSDCYGETQKPFALGPGVTFIALTPHFSLTLDARAELVLAEKATTGLLFGVGIGF